MVEEKKLSVDNYPKLWGSWNVPCLVCDFLEKCTIGQEYNPISCEWMNHYLALNCDENH